MVYQPAHDRRRNYVPTVLGDRYDAFLWFAETHALHPLSSTVDSGAFQF
ncbi:hypothetical protein [Lentzea kristufekii]